MTEVPRAFGVLVTYRRREELSATLERLRAQSRRLDLLLVVDNGSDPEIEAIVSGVDDGSLTARYVDAGDNLGPAGGFALGMAMLLEEAGDSDWIFLFDDDDPPFFDDAIEQALRFATEMVSRHPETAGVGISGGRFDLSRGRVLRIPDDQIRGAVEVDHITGGGLPAYRVGAVRKVGPLRSELFFGFEELEYGLRLTRAGYTLFADGEQWATRKQVKREQGLLPPESVSADRAARVSLRLTGSSWRRFYSLRNLVFVLRQAGANGAAVRVALTRGLLKPLLNLPLAPRLAWANLRMSLQAVWAGWRGHLGRTLSPSSGPAQDAAPD